MEETQTVIVSIPHKSGAINVRIDVGELDATITLPGRRPVVFVDGDTIEVDALRADLS